MVQNLQPTLATSQRVLHFDFPGLTIGCAEYREGPTGSTIFSFDRGVHCAADIRGGSSLAVLLDGWETGDALVNAICFAGGSCCGLSAIAGTVTSLFERTEDPASFENIPRVMGAVIYDFRPRQNLVYPDAALSDFALKNSFTNSFPLGPHGAGASASAGKVPNLPVWEIAGQGASFREGSGFKVGIFTVVNSIGAIIDRTGKTVRGFYDREKGVRFSPLEMCEYLPRTEDPGDSNTTLTLLVTDLELSPFLLRQIARQTHSSMARAIQPFHSRRDGDILFAITTARVKANESAVYSLPILAAEAAWDAVLSSYDPEGT